MARAAQTHIERLQCFEGITEEKAIGKFDESLQRLYVELSTRNQGMPEWERLGREITALQFFTAGPLLKALRSKQQCVLLVDEIDKVDKDFEATLLEILSVWQLSIPRLGTVDAVTIPFTVLTSNEERRLGDPLRRRCLYLRIEHPTAEREGEIVALRTPKAGESTHRLMAGFAKALRAYCLEKPPSIAEMIDIALGIDYLGIGEVTDAHRDVLLPMIAKTKKDRERLTLSDGFKSILYASHLYAGADARPGSGGGSRQRCTRARAGGPERMKGVLALAFALVVFASPGMAATRRSRIGLLRESVCRTLPGAGRTGARDHRAGIGMESARRFRKGRARIDAAHAANRSFTRGS